MRPPVDFVIITALEEERDAVLAKLPGAQKLPPSAGDVRVYYAAELPATFPDGKTCVYSVIVAPLLNMGRVEAATATGDAIRHWKPAYVLLVGIAGGIAASGAGVGDVLVSDQIVDYEVQKVTSEGPEVRYSVHRADPSLLSAAKNYLSADWTKLVQVNRPKEGSPQRKVGPIATGDKVVALASFLKKYQESWPKLIGVEMEAGGAATACFESKPAPGFFMIRAVSDLADEDKDKPDAKKWWLYACDVAASYAIGLLKSGPVLPLPEIPPPLPQAEPRVFLSKLPTTSGDLFGRERELAVLDAAWAEPRTHVVVVSAWGGVGKTALVNHWLNRLEQEHYRGAACVYGWSFYSQGTREDRQASGDTFFAHALEWFGDPDPKQGAPWDKGVRLAGLVRKQRTLLILDGLEPLQYPPGAMQCRLRDKGVEALLKELARAGTDWGLCVVTTRVAVPELEEMKHTSVQSMPLENLSDEAGVDLLRNLGVTRGTEDELRETSRDFKGHALALTLLGRYIAVVHKGEIRKRDLVPALEDEEAQGGHAKRVMRSYAIWLEGKPELDILHLLGLFDRPADGGAIQALRKKPVIKGLTNALRGLSEAQWQYAVQHLRDLRLLDRKDDGCPDTLDCHPLVREHFGAVLKTQHPTAWKEAHSRLYEHYKALPEKLYGKFLPDTIEEMEPLYRAVAHGCHAGRQQETLVEVYYPRIHRSAEAYGVKKLGAFGAELAALSGFFDEPWRQPATGLGDAHKAAMLNWAGFGLRALGRLREAREPMKTSLTSAIDREDWKNAAIAACTLSELSLTLGDVQAAVDYARQSVDFAERSGDSFERFSDRSTLADALHQAGELPEAERLFREAEALQQKSEPENPFLYSQQGYRFCDLLLSQRQFQQVQKRVGQTISIARRNKWLLDVALDHLSLGKAAWLQGQAEGPGAFPEAARYLDQAVQGLREAGAQHHLPRGLLARAALYRVTGAWADAGRDLAEAQEIAERGEMQLFLADYHIEAARLFHAVTQASRLPESAQAAEAFLRRLPQEFETLLVATTGSDRTAPESSGPQQPLSPTAFALAKAREYLATAKEMVARMGYGRRNPEVEELEKLLAAE